MRWGAVLILLAACGRGGGGISASVTPTTTTTTVTVRQVASVVAKHRPELVKAIDFDHDCPSIECLFAAARVGRFEKIADQIAAFETELGALRPQPAEIKGLVDDTMSQLILDTSLASSLRRCFAANTGKPIDPCEADFSTWSRNLVSLKRQLAAWDPYL
jgi:hypothetical protein